MLVVEVYIIKLYNIQGNSGRNQQFKKFTIFIDRAYVNHTESLKVSGMCSIRDPQDIQQAIIQHCIPS
jgi:hypothetical protein